MGCQHLAPFAFPPGRLFKGMGNVETRRAFGLQPKPGFAEEAQRRLLDGHFVARVLSGGDRIGDESLEYSLSPAGLEALQQKVENHAAALSSGVRDTDSAKSVVRLLERLQASFTSAPWFAACLERRLIVLSHAHECLVHFPPGAQRDGVDSDGRPYLPVMTQIADTSSGRHREPAAPRVATARTLLSSGLPGDEPRAIVRGLHREYMSGADGAWYKEYAPLPQPAEKRLPKPFLVWTAKASSEVEPYGPTESVNTTGTGWRPATQAGPVWWTCQMKSRYPVCSVEMEFGAGITEVVQAVTVSTSLDGERWVERATVATAARGITVARLPGVPAQYIKLAFDKAVGVVQLTNVDVRQRAAGSSYDAAADALGTADELVQLAASPVLRTEALQTLMALARVSASQGVLLRLVKALASSGPAQPVPSSNFSDAAGALLKRLASPGSTKEHKCEFDTGNSILFAIGADGSQVQAQGEKGIAVVKTGFAKGKHSWEFRLLTPDVAELALGATTRPLSDLDFQSSPHMHVLRCDNGALWGKGKRAASTVRSVAACSCVCRCVSVVGSCVCVVQCIRREEYHALPRSFASTWIATLALWP